MVIEKILFNLIAIALFTIIFLKLIRKNDTSYIIILTIEFIGIAINFIELFLPITLNWFFKALIYILAIIIPLWVLWLEYFKKMNFPEFFHLLIGEILIKSGKQEKAKLMMTNFLRKNQNSQVAHKFMAECYEREENYEAAISEYMRVVDLNGNDLNAAYCLASAMNKNKQNEQAIIVLQDILKKKPENENVANLLGDIYFEEERYKEAASVYMALLRYHPASYDIYYNLGMIYTMINDFGRAKEFYEKAADINSMNYHAKLSLGQIALIYGDLDEAEKYFMQGIKSEETESGSYYYLSKIAMLKGDQDKATNYMKVAVDLNPNNYKQLHKDPIFMPIRKEIPKPEQVKNQEIEEVKKETDAEMQEVIEENENKQKNKEKSSKERKVYYHLMKTNLLIENLSNEELMMIRNKKEKQKMNEIQQREKGQE